jgi:hypothetical protein
MTSSHKIDATHRMFDVLRATYQYTPVVATSDSFTQSVMNACRKTRFQTLDAPERLQALLTWSHHHPPPVAVHDRFVRGVLQRVSASRPPTEDRSFSEVFQRYLIRQLIVSGPCAALLLLTVVTVGVAPRLPLEVLGQSIAAAND